VVFSLLIFFLKLAVLRSDIFVRALKTKSATPKFGLLYHSTFIGRAGVKSKGKISRFLANKCSIASRIDCFSGSDTSTFGLLSNKMHYLTLLISDSLSRRYAADTPTSKFGEALKKQVEERLSLIDNDRKDSSMILFRQSKNSDIMKQVLNEIQQEALQKAAEEGDKMAIDEEQLLITDEPMKSKLDFTNSAFSIHFV
jgi:nucleolar protein 56